MDWTFEEFVKWASQHEATISFRRLAHVHATEIRCVAGNFSVQKCVSDIELDNARFDVMVECARASLQELSHTVGG